MKQLKFELVNRYGVLVDEESDPFLLPTEKTYISTLTLENVIDAVNNLGILKLV